MFVDNLFRSPFWGLQIIESEHLTELETARYPETTWRRVYRRERIDYIVFPKRELYLMKPNTVIAHPVVVRLFRDLIETSQVSQAMIDRINKYKFAPIQITSRYVYDWRLFASLLLFVSLIALVYFATL